ncbi:MAG: hypothetical protein J6T49_04535 [Bacteroidales bacterium]|nr:hypothetical protein [Bacteroidales bacterium]MBO7479710.1 hypothetical protein [Bacteroidales bacterium]MBO7487653.1 hypothetical protein [Bacteroidales bacterium]
MKKVFFVIAFAMLTVIGASAQMSDFVTAKVGSNIRLGYVGAANNSNVAGGFDLGINVIEVGVRPYSTGELTLGADFLMDIYHPTSGKYFLSGGHSTTIVPSIFSKIKYSTSTVLGFGIPLNFTQRISDKLSVTAGATARINMNASTRLVYTNSDNKWNTERASGIYTNRVTYDLHLSVDVDGFGIYASYCPMNVFESGHGPSFNTFAVGLIFKH